MLKERKHYELHYVTLDMLTRDRFGNQRHPVVPIVIDTDTRMVVYDATALDLIIHDVRRPGRTRTPPQPPARSRIRKIAA